MNHMLIVLIVACIAQSGSASAAQSGSVSAQPPAMVQGSPGTTGSFTTPFGSAQSGVQGFGSVPEPIIPAPILPFGPRVSPLLTPGSPKTPPVAPPASSGSGTGLWKR
jgi:hypothetical protein